MTQSMGKWLVFIFFELLLSYQFMIFDLQSDSYPACNSVSLHRQVKRKMPLSLVVPEFSSLPHRHSIPTKGQYIPTGVSMTTTHFSNRENTHCQI